MSCRRMSYRSCVHAALRTPSKRCLYKPTHSSRRGAPCTPVRVCTHALAHTHYTRARAGTGTGMRTHARVCTVHTPERSLAGRGLHSRGSAGKGARLGVDPGFCLVLRTAQCLHGNSTLQVLISKPNSWCTYHTSGAQTGEEEIGNVDFKE